MIKIFDVVVNFDDTVRKNRSYRRFYEEEKISRETLLKLVGYARMSASSANLQALKYFLSDEKEKNDKIFNQLKWASYLKNWDGPGKGERPSAFIIILSDTRVHATIEIDVGIAAQTILLGAVTLGYGGCMIASFNRKKLAAELNIPESFQIPLVIALGKPKETVVIDEVDSNGNIEYWRDENQIHHVPKRSLKEIVVDF